MAQNCKTVTMVLLGAALVAVSWIALFFVLFSQDYLMNEHYSAKTMHLHKVTQNARIPIQWNSLGYVTPYVEQEFGDRKWEPTTYFLHGGMNKNTNDYSTLEDPFSYTMYINSERSFSILSSISPLLYLATLIVICNISLLYFSFAHYAEPEICSFHKNQVRSFLSYATLLIYGCCLFAIFGAGAIIKDEQWGSVQIEYMISPQIPSVVYNIIVLAMYCLYLRRKDSYKSTAEITTDKEMPGVTAVNSAAHMQNIQLQSMYTPTWNMMPGQKQHLLMGISGVVMQKEKEEKKERTSPVTNEFNVVVCIIVLLGGIANLAMSQAFLMETEAQLVIISLFMFGVLELGRNHLVSYFWYLSVNSAWETTAEDKTERYIIVFIDLVVFLLQLFIVFIWQMTMTSLLTITQSNVLVLRMVLIVVVSLFLLTRFVSVFQGLLEVYFPSTCCGCDLSCMTCLEYDDAKRSSKILYIMEFVMYFLIVSMIIGTLFVIAMPGSFVFHNPEKRLILLEQMMYQNTNTPTPKTECSNGIQKNNLVAHINELCSDISSEVYKIRPVTMKVFAWTRSFVLQKQVISWDAGLAAADVLFCSNGFEQHWGQCKRQFLDPKEFSIAWNEDVLKAASLSA